MKKIKIKKINNVFNKFDNNINKIKIDKKELIYHLILYKLFKIYSEFINNELRLWNKYKWYLNRDKFMIYQITKIQLKLNIDIWKNIIKYIILNNYWDVFKKIAHLTDWFSWRDIKNITKILIKRKLNKELKDKNKIINDINEIYKKVTKNLVIKQINEIIEYEVSEEKIKEMILNYYLILEDFNFNDYFDSIEEFILWKEKELKLNEETLYRIAIHELGHAVIWYINWKEILKVAIWWKNMSLWQTFSINAEDDDKLLRTKNDYIKEIEELLWWRAAEKIILWDISTWAFNDYERATNLAVSFFLNNLEYITKDWKKLKLWIVINPNNIWNILNVDSIKNDLKEFSKIMISELEEKVNKKIEKNKNLIIDYWKKLVKDKIFVWNKLKEFLEKISY